MADAIGPSIVNSIINDKISNGIGDYLPNPLFVQINSLDDAPIEKILYHISDRNTSAFFDISHNKTLIAIPVLDVKPANDRSVLSRLGLYSDSFDVRLRPKNGEGYSTGSISIYYFIYRQDIIAMLPATGYGTSHILAASESFRATNNIVVLRNTSVA